MMFSKNAALPALSLLASDPEARNGARPPSPSALPAAAPSETTPGTTPAQTELPPAPPISPLHAQVAAARLLVSINNWEFAERVWVGLRPHLRTRLWLLDTLQARGPVPPSGTIEDTHRLKHLVAEIHRIETEVEEILRRRTSLTEFSSLLEQRLAPCLGQLEHLQQALHERHDG